MRMDNAYGLSKRTIYLAFETPPESYYRDHYLSCYSIYDHKLG
jgi:hypothetical protein